jgi:acyl carrier protein
MGNHGLSPPKDKGDDLIVAGLNSMGMVALMLAIEGEFNVTIPNTELIPTNFRSIRSVQTLLERLHADP